MPRKRAGEKTLVTLQQIGKACGVTTKTVSLALRGDPAVSKQKANEIQAKAIELGYTPRRERSGALGLIVPYLAHLTYGELIGSIRPLASARGAILLIGESMGNLEVERRLIIEFSRRGVEGVVLISPRSSPIELDNLSRFQQPFVSVFLPVGADSLFEFGSVEIDNAAGAEEAVTHLLMQGHERIVYLAGRLTSASEQRRRRGYQNALQKAGVTYQKPLVVEIGGGVTQPWPSFEAGYMQCQQMLERRMNPDAILAYNDMVAIGAMRALQENGLRVPEDVSIIGFDNVTLSQFVTPPLTSVGVQRDEIASAVVDMVYRLASTDNTSLARETLHHMLLPDLIVRESVRRRNELVNQ